LRELLQAKVEQRAPQIEIATEGKAKPEVVNIMTALKKSMEAKGREKDSSEANGQAYERGTAKGESVTTPTKPAPNGALRNSLMWRYDAGNNGEIRAH
jgi:hypothetical protein